MLTAIGADVWVSSASVEGRAHLVPLSLAWDGLLVMVATGPESTTTRNIAASRQARLALGHTRDVVMIEVELDAAVAVTEAPDELVQHYVRQTLWDPRESGEPCSFLTLRPVTIQAWREVDEMVNRTLMRHGAWVD